MGLSLIQRQAARLLLRFKLAELHGEAFETFFHDLMAHVSASFADVRTAGSLGDIGSDGLLVNEGKLYASYAPEVFDYKRVIDKLSSDFTKAMEKRKDQFEVFVFVHNDLRGIHPAISQELPRYRKDYPTIKFELFGHRQFRKHLLEQEISVVEDLLGRELPVKEIVYGPGLDELESLLEHLSALRSRQHNDTPIHPVSDQKLSYNSFSPEIHDSLRRAMVESTVIDNYYAGRIDTTELDEVATAFRREYLDILEECDEPDEVVYYLEQFVMGNALAPLKTRLAATAVISYFFQRCDIFEDAPDGWSGSSEQESA